MSKFNFLVYLNSYADQHASNAPDRNQIKWERAINGLPAGNPGGYSFSLAPGESRDLFSGARTLSQNNTTQYSIALVPFTTTTYELSWVGGTKPNFRTSRATGQNGSTQVTVTVNGPVVTFESTGGALWNLTVGGVVVGDYAFIGDEFNTLNQGSFQIISLTNTSFSISNATGAAEGPITLGGDYANQIKIFTAAGVQVNDTLVISGGFSPVTQNSYIVTSVLDNSLQFSSLNPLPQEGPIVTEAIAVYFMAKKLIYVESDQKVDLEINGVSGNDLSPLIDCTGSNKPGIFLKTSTMYSLTVTNESVNQANLYFASLE